MQIYSKNRRITTKEEKYYKISLDSNWKIILEETEFSVIDGSTTP